MDIIFGLKKKISSPIDDITFDLKKGDDTKSSWNQTKKKRVFNNNRKIDVVSTVLLHNAKEIFKFWIRYMIFLYNTVVHCTADEDENGINAMKEFVKCSLNSIK